MEKHGLLFTGIVINRAHSYYIIVTRFSSRIMAGLDRLRKEAQELVLEGLQPAGGRYVVYLGTGAELKKAGLEDVRSSLNLETIIYTTQQGSSADPDSCSATFRSTLYSYVFCICNGEL